MPTLAPGQFSEGFGRMGQIPTRDLSLGVFFLNTRTPTNFPAKPINEETSLVAQRAESHLKSVDDARTARLRDASQKVLQRGRRGLSWRLGTGPAGGKYHQICQTCSKAWPSPCVCSTAAARASSELAPMGFMLNKAPSGSYADPFDATAVPITPHEHSLMSYCGAIEMRTGWSEELSTRNGKDHLIPAGQSMRREQLTNSKLVHSALSHCYSFMIMIHPPQKDRYHRSALVHANYNLRATRELIENLDGSRGQWLTLLQLVIFQVATEWSLGNFESSLAHCAPLPAIVDRLGGLNQIPWLLREFVVNIITDVPLPTQGRTMVDPSWWDPGPWSAYAGQEGQLEGRMPSPALASAGQPDTITSIFACLRDLVMTEELKRVKLATGKDDLNDLFRWSYLRKHAVKARLANYWHAIATSTKALEPPSKDLLEARAVYYATLDMCLTLAMQLFVYIRFYGEFFWKKWPQGLRFIFTMLFRCVNKLDVAVDAVGPTHPNARHLLWVIAMGAYTEAESARRMSIADSTCRLHESSDGFKNWFGARFGSLARRIGYSSFDNLILMFRQYCVYDTIIHGVTLKKVFDHKE